MNSLADEMRTKRPVKAARRRRQIIVVSLAVIAGCATDDPFLSSERTYPPDQAQPGQATGQPATAAAAPSMLARAPEEPTPKPAAGAATAAPGPVASLASISPAALQDLGVMPAANAMRLPDPSPLVLPPPMAAYPIDLATALRLADVANPTIGAARTLILEALALQTSARVLLVPSLNAGGNYHGQNGVLQRSSGKILNLSEQSLYFGAGARTLAAESVAIPGILIYSALTDAWFEPLAAQQRLIGARFGARATSYNILLDVALLHIELLGNQSILDLQRLSESQFHEVYRLTKDYADAGQGRDADANRALSQWKRRAALVQKAEEDVAVTAASLANRLNLDPSVRLEPIGGPIVPLNLIDLATSRQELLAVALRQRPDIQARTAAIGQAEAHYKQEIARPLLPTLWLGFSGGAFGGGSNLVPPLMGNFAGRTDFDVRVYWTILNMGAGNMSLIKERNAEIGQAVAERAMTINDAREEVAAALAQAQAAQNEIDVARRELASAELAYEEDLSRTRNMGENRPRDVLPIELLNNLDLLAGARVNLIKALVLYDQSQFSLWVSLGSPPPLVSD